MEIDKTEVQAHLGRCQQTRKQLKDYGVLGPWIEEPDRVQFKHAGLDCLLLRNEFLFNWCGYAGVPPGNLFHGEQSADLEDSIIVHGGITYEGNCSGIICHGKEKGEHDLYWRGFDCGHLYDLVPGIEFNKKFRRYETPPQLKEMEEKLKKMAEENPHLFPKSTYKDLEYVMAQTKKLAEQLARKNEAL